MEDIDAKIYQTFKRKGNTEEEGVCQEKGLQVLSGFEHCYRLQGSEDAETFHYRKGQDNAKKNDGNMRQSSEKIKRGDKHGKAHCIPSFYNAIKMTEEVI